MNPNNPLLTIIIPARNDNFMGNFHYRLTSTLDILAATFSDFGKLGEVEVLISDWGSEVPLHRVLKLSHEARQIVRYLVIPSSIAKNEQKDSEFPIVLAQNAAIRRARGQYVMQTDSDVVFTREFLSHLWPLLEGKRSHYVNVSQALIGSKRRQIPWDIISKSPPADLLLQFVRDNSEKFPTDADAGFGYCTTGMMFMHRDLWAECSGYDEKLIHWGWMEIDLGLRITQKHPWFDMSHNFKTFIYHMEHYRPETGRAVTRKYNPMNKNNVYRPNGDDWGLARYDLEIATQSEIMPATSLLG